MSHKVTSIVPEHIQLDRPQLMTFLEAYYDFLQEPDQPGTFMKNLPVHRNIDNTADIFLELLQRELATPIPETIIANKRKLYKNITDIYLSKGATPSFESLFKLIFNDEIELCYNQILSFVKKQKSSSKKISFDKKIIKNHIKNLIY